MPHHCTLNPCVFSTWNECLRTLQKISGTSGYGVAPLRASDVPLKATLQRQVSCQLSQERKPALQSGCPAGPQGQSRGSALALAVAISLNHCGGQRTLCRGAWDLFPAYPETLVIGIDSGEQEGRDWFQLGRPPASPPSLPLPLPCPGLPVPSGQG